MSADTTQWTPPSGRHQVSMGGSMTRFLKQRKGIQVKQNKGMPTSNYYYFKYNFMPESVDNTRPGSVEVSQGKDVTGVRVERACFASEDVHVYRGKEEPAKEVECVLIYDEETRMFTLEKLDSSLTLHHEGKGPAKARPHSASPLPTPSPAASTSKIDMEEDLAAELDRELLTTLVEEDDTGPAPAPSATAKRKAGPPLRPPPVDTTNGKPKPKLRGSATGLSKGKATASKPAPPLPTPSKSAKSKPAPISVEEVFEIELPTRAAAASVTSMGLPDSEGLALPTFGSTAALAPAPVQEEEDDEDDWDEVAGVGPLTTSQSVVGAEDMSIFGDADADGDAEEGIEINVDQFEALMNEELLGDEEDADGDGGGDMEDIFGDAADANDGYEEPNQGMKPMSLNQFAGGAPADDDDDDFSSSEDSEDD